MSVTMSSSAVNTAFHFLYLSQKNYLKINANRYGILSNVLGLKEIRPLSHMNFANLTNLHFYASFFLIHITFSSPFLLHQAYMTSEFQEQCATAGAASLDLYVGQ